MYIRKYINIHIHTHTYIFYIQLLHEETQLTRTHFKKETRKNKKNRPEHGRRPGCEPAAAAAAYWPCGYGTGCCCRSLRGTDDDY